MCHHGKYGSGDSYGSIVGITTEVVLSTLLGLSLSVCGQFFLSAPSCHNRETSSHKILQMCNRDQNEGRHTNTLAHMWSWIHLLQ